MEIYKFVNTHPKCMSMLYDLNLMPETTKPDNLNYIRMIAIIHLFDQIEELRETIKDALIHRDSSRKPLPLGMERNGVLLALQLLHSGLECPI